MLWQLPLLWRPWRSWEILSIGEDRWSLRCKIRALKKQCRLNKISPQHFITYCVFVCVSPCRTSCATAVKNMWKIWAKSLKKPWRYVLIYDWECSRQRRAELQWWNVTQNMYLTTVSEYTSEVLVFEIFFFHNQKSSTFEDRQFFWHVQRGVWRSVKRYNLTPSPLMLS